jgi:tetratricopeptide (TPR) repeat protein
MLNSGGILCPQTEVYVINKSKILKDVQKYVAKSQWDKAIIEYEKILAGSPNDANTFNTVGDLCLKRNDNEKAIESFKKAAEIFNKTGFTLKAIALYKKVLNIKPDQVDVFLMMGKLNAERGMVGNANENYLAAASYFTKQGQRSKAIDIYKTLCELNPDNFSLAQKLTELYLSEGFEREGINKCIELAEKKFAQGDLSGAREFLAKVKEKASGGFEFNRVCALIDLKEDRLHEAVSRLEELRKLDPNDTRIQTSLAEAYLRSGRFDESRAIYEVLRDKNPQDMLYRQQLINLELKTGDFDSAWTENEALADWHISRNEFSDAEKFLREFLAQKADSTAALNLLAYVLEKQDRQEEAQTIRRQAEVLNVPAPSPEEEIRIEAAPAAPEAVLPPLVEGMSLPDLPMPDAPIPDEPLPDTHLQDASSPDAPILDEPLPDLADEFGELPPMELGEDDELGEIPQDIGPDGFREDKELEGLDIFAVNKGLDESSGADETGIHSSPGDGIPDVEEPAAEPLEKSFEELLGEADVLLRYGMTEKVTDILNSLSETRPRDPELKKRYIELYKAQGDLDSFINVSVELADIYNSMGMEAEAEAVLGKARRLDPADPRLAPKPPEPSSTVYEIDAVSEVPELPEEELPAQEEGQKEQEVLPESKVYELDDLPGEEISLPADKEVVPDTQPELGAQLEPDVQLEDVALPEQESEEQLFSTVDPIELEHLAGSSMTPGSVHYVEERAEADFYAQQGLYQEAVTIYEKLLSVNPDDNEVRERHDTLLDSLAKEPGPQDIELVTDEQEHSELQPYAEPSAEIHEETSEEDDVFKALDNELEQAFKETWDEPVSGGDFEEETADEPFMTPDPEQSAEVVSSGFRIQEPKVDEDFFDLGAELREEFEEEAEAPAAEKTSDVFEDKLLEDVFQEFKKGVEDQLNKEDYETHYNLGIAYKEMGMLDEALGEFELASRDPGRLLDCASMSGLCYIEKGEYDAAIINLKKGLEAEGREPDEYLGLKYDLATAYELSGDIASAQSAVEEITGADNHFRDVKERLQRLNKALKESGAAPPAKDKKKPEEKSGGEKPGGPKKNRVSYL